MADALGGSTDPADPTAIRNQTEPTVPLYSIWQQITGTDGGLGQAQGLRARPYDKQETSSQLNVTGGLMGVNMQQPFKTTTKTVNVPAQHVTLNQALSEMHNWPPEKLAQWTARLYNAGFYADKAYGKGEKPPSGKVVTQDDIYATVNLISTAQRYGDTKTIDEIIQDFTTAGEGQKKLDAQQKKAQGQVYNIVTDDPATLRANVTKVAQAVLGRQVTEEEQNALVNRMIQAEKAPQQAQVTAGQKADQGGDVILETARVDAEARLKEKLEADHGAEAGAYKELNYFNALSQALRGQ